jgi:hypothetical protein
MKSGAFFLCLLIGLAACSSKESDNPYATVSGFCAGWGQAACSTKVVANCSGSDATDDLTKACVASQKAFCEGLVPDGYVSDQAGTCLSAVKDAYGDGTLDATDVATVRHLGNQCNHLIKGPKAQGEACTVDTDCDTVDNYVCVLKAGVGACAIPMVVGNGTSCKAAGATCNTGFYCDKNCIASAVAGEDCAQDYECLSGLRCEIPADASTGSCVAPVSQSKCTGDADCAAPKVCDIAAGASTGTCVSKIVLTPDAALCQDLQ